MNINFSKNSNIGLSGQLKSSQNRVIEVVLLVIFCVLFFWFLITPKKAQVTVKKDELAKIQVEEGQIATKLATLNSLVKELESHPDEVAHLDQALPLDGNTIKMTLLLEALAKSVGVTVGDISVAAQGNTLVSGNKELLKHPFGATRTLQKLSGSIYVIGTFNQLEAFLKKLENSGRIIEISDMGLDANEGNNLNMKLTFNSYYLAPVSP